MKKELKLFLKKSKSLLKNTVVILLLSLVVLFPLSSTNTEFLDALTYEITILDNHWTNLQLELKEQKADYRELKIETKELWTLSADNKIELTLLKNDIQELKVLPKVLETQYNDLKISLKESEKKLRKQEIKSTILTVGIVTVSIGTILVLVFK